MSRQGEPWTAILWLWAELSEEPWGLEVSAGTVGIGDKGPLCFAVSVFEIRSLAQATSGTLVLLPQPPKCWHDRCVSRAQL